MGMKRFQIYVGDLHMGAVNAKNATSAKRKAIEKTGLSYKLKVRRK